MKNWPKYYFNKKEQYLTSLVLFLGKRIKKEKRYRLPLIESIKYFVYRRENQPLDKFYLDGIDLQLLTISYIDIYFLEEFKMLGIGLQKMLQVISNSTEYTNSNSIKNWIEKCSLESSGNTTLEIGWIELQEDKHRYFRRIHIQLIHSCSNIITLTITFDPTTSFIKKLQSIITLGVKRNISVINMNLNKILATFHTSSETALELEIDRFFLEANKYTTKLLRKYVKCGTALIGPLRSIEVLQTNIALDELSRIQEKENSKDHYKNLFKILGNPVYRDLYYSDWLQLYKVDRKSFYNNENMQIIFSTQSFEAERLNILKQFDLYYDESNPILGEYLETVSSISSILAIDFYITKLTESILNSRKSHIQDIQKGKLGRFTLRKLLQLNSLYYKYQRINDELSLTSTKEILQGQFQEIKRQQYDSDDVEFFGNDIESNIGKNLKFIEKQIQFLKSSYSDYIQLRFTKSNYKIQITLVALTIILALLTIIMVLPKEYQESIQNYIKNLI